MHDMYLQLLLTWLFSLGEKFRENVGKTFHVDVIFTILLLFLHKGIWVLFSRGGNFCEEDKSAKNAKITPLKISTFSAYRVS